MSNLTPEQELAVNEFGKNIIVSAGAGSGKTKVLTERVFKHVLKDKIDIDKMLILTFTKAAASEMKKRIRDILNDDKSLNPNIRNIQLNKIDSSYISTFDAYALSLVKKYHQVLDVDNTIEIIDSNIFKNKAKEYLDEILDEEYKKKDIKFTNLIKHFCIKNDDLIRDTIIDLNNSLNQIYDRQDYLDTYLNNMYSDNALDKNIDDYVSVLKSKIKEMNDILNELSSYVDDIHSFFPYIDDLNNALSYNEIKDIIHLAKTNGNVKNPKGTQIASNLKKKLNNQIDSLKQLTKYTIDQLKTNYLNTKDDCLVILDLTNRLNNKLDEYKKLNNTYDYIDIMKLSIKLVKDNIDIRKEIKDYFKEILIDEYQDTNDLQDLFISYIANNNVYMVGDIKQSIYRFRNANPKIFMNKYDDYKNNIGGMSIDLTYNFRSRNEVLDNINVVFNKIMTTSTGGVNYTKGHQMICGNLAYKDNKDINDNNLELLSYTYDKDTKDKFPFDELTKDEVEAFIVAKDIKDKINSQFKVATYIDEKMTLRNCEYKDFSILIDRGTNFDMFKEVLTYFNIPCVIKKEDKMSDSDLIVVFKNIFKLLSLDLNDTCLYDFKFSYASLARSFIIELDDKKLFDIVKNDTYKDTDLYKKLINIKQDIDIKTISQILDEIIDNFNIYSNIYKIGDVNNNLVKIDYLYDLASKLANSGYTYKDFSKYLDGIFDSNDDIEFNTAKQEENAVIITTIHKSKGLEYPIVYLPLLFKKFNDDETKKNILFNKKLGLILPEYVENRGIRNTFKKDLYNYNFYNEEISERIRLLYVALTRAKEKLVLVGPIKDNSKDGTLISKEDILASRSFLSLLELIYDDLNKNDFIKEVDLNSIGISKDYHDKKKDIFKSLSKVGEKINIKSVNPIIPSLIRQSHFSKNSGLIDIDTIKKMEYGTKMHYYLETLDFNNPDFDLIDKEFIDKIKTFLNSDLLKDKAKAKVYKEYEFIEITNNEEKHGIIDLLMEYDDHFDIIDYKLKNIDDIHYDEQLNGYRQYINSISDKKVNCYLYSVIDGNYREVK